MVEAVDDGLCARDPLGRRDGDDEDEDEERGGAVVTPSQRINRMELESSFSKYITMHTAYSVRGGTTKKLTLQA